MASNHICIESCFSSRTSDRLALLCFICENKFNSKCFNLSAQHFMKLLTSANNAFFMCYRCIDRVNKMKQNQRRSNDANSSSLNQKNDVANSANRNNNSNEEDNGRLSNILSLLTKLDENLARLNLSNDIFKQNILDAREINSDSNGALSSHDLIDSYTDRIDSLLESKISNMKESILSYDQVEEIFKKNSSHNKTFSKTVGNGRISNPLDWTMSSPNHRTYDNSGDLFSILHSFETNTWASLDLISNTTKKNNEILNKLFLDDKCESSSIGRCSRSALVETINCENRIELIHQDLSSLKDDFSLFANKFDLNMLERDPLTLQHMETILSEASDFDILRNRFHNLIGKNVVEPSIDSEIIKPSPSHADFDGLASKRRLNPVALKTKEKTCETQPKLSSSDSEVVTSKRSLHLLGNKVSSAFLDVQPSFEVSHLTTNLMTVSAPSEIIKPQPSHVNSKGISSKRSLNSDPLQINEQVCAAQLKHTSSDAEAVTSKRNVHLLGNKVSSPSLDNHFHISPFHTTVTSDDILQYIAENSVIDKNKVRIRRLTKKGQDISSLKHINFKIETDDEISKVILNSNFWPNHIRIKSWIPPSKPQFIDSPQPFLGSRLT